MALATPIVPSHGNCGCPLAVAEDFGHRIFSNSACFHHTKSAGQALRLSLVKPGAYLSASYGTVEAVLIEHWQLCRVNGRILLVNHL